MEKGTKKIPVIVVLGHIDHGKSSLLEAIRDDFKITNKESGGITQHIGAYEIEYEGQKITFIDTPGHEAFSEMRSRGAKVADIAILVVAADEGVKPQTKEAINTIKEAKIPSVIVLNKIDKENVDIQKAKGELQNTGVLIEEWGGDIPIVEVSAKTKKGIKELLSVLRLLTEVSEIKSDEDKKPKGFVLESHLNSFCGPKATLIIEEGRLKEGDVIKTETTFGKIKAMKNFKLQDRKEAIPGEAVVVTGFKDVPGVGESFYFSSSVDDAQKELLEKKTEEDISPLKEKEDIDNYLKTIIKGDCKGSVEVLSKILNDLIQDKIGIKILNTGVGDITDSDIRLADNENALIIGFRVFPNAVAKTQASQREVKILTFEVIYDLIDNIRKEMANMREKKKERVDLGKIKPLIIFKTQKRGEKKYRQIIGGKVIEGEVKKSEVEIKRGEEILEGGRILELQEQKKKIEKAKSPREIGISYEGKTKIKEDDILLVFEIIET